MWLCKRDLSKECDGKYKDCVDCVLDKIRVEIVQVANQEKFHDEKWAIGLRYAVKIIDKYKYKSESEE